MYTFFDKAAADVSENGTLELVLSGAGYDENWNPVTLPVEGAVITVNGEKTAFVTDKDGKVSVKLDKAGKYTVTAVSDDKALVPAVCIVNVTVIFSSDRRQRRLCARNLRYCCSLCCYGCSETQKFLCGIKYLR